MTWSADDNLSGAAQRKVGTQNFRGAAPLWFNLATSVIPAQAGISLQLASI
jgi:hypothetical protein